MQEIVGVSPQLFSVLFGLNALGLMVASQVNGRLVGRLSPRRLLAVGLVATASGGAALLVAVAGGLGLAGVLPSLFVVVSSLGFVMPNATTLALAGHPRTAGSASALLGVLQFAVGAAAAPLAGLAGATTALPMSLVIAALGLAALASFALLSKAHKESGPNQIHAA